MTWLPEQLETVPCDLCGGTVTKQVFTRPDQLTVVECADCALCFLNPRPKRGFISELYGREYFRKSGTHDTVGYTDYLDDSSVPGKIVRAGQLLRYLPGEARIEGSRCMDVGCATGELCHVLKSKGARPVGVDLSEEAIRIAEKRYPDLEFHVGDITGTPLEGAFGLIFGLEVIEHVLSPSTCIRRMRELLLPGGHVVLTTPNYDCAKAIGVARWTGFMTSLEHLYFFTPATLTAYAEALGYEVVTWLTGGGDGVHSEEIGIPYKPLWKAATKPLLSAMGLLGPARRALRLIRNRGMQYSRLPNRHNLLIVMKSPLRSGPHLNMLKTTTKGDRQSVSP